MSQKKSKATRKTVSKLVKSHHYEIMKSYLDVFCQQDFKYRWNLAWSILRRTHPFRIGKVEKVKKVKQKAEACHHSQIVPGEHVGSARFKCEKGDIKHCRKCRVFLAKIEKGGEK